MYRLLAAGEPPELRSYLTIPKSDHAVHSGTTVPVLGLVKRHSSGLFVPINAQFDPQPLDRIGVLLTAEDLYGTAGGLPEIVELATAIGVENLLTWCAFVLRRLRSEEGWGSSAAIEFVRHLPPAARARGEALIAEGRVLFSRESMFVLAKIALKCSGPENTPEADFLGPVAAMALMLNDVSGARSPGFIQRFPGDFPSDVIAWLAANQFVNADIEESSFMACFEDRWNNDDRDSSKEVKDEFRKHMGYSIREQAWVALILWMAATADGAVVFDRCLLTSLDVESGIVDRILLNVSRTPEEFASEIDLDNVQELLWDHDQLGNSPLIRMSDDRYLLLDPSLLIRRCLGWAPMYDLPLPRGNSERLLARATEDYAISILEGLYDSTPLRRVFPESELKSLSPESRCADAVVDFGSSFAVFEISARRVPRRVVHGSPDAVSGFFEILLDEIGQVAATSRVLQEKRHLLTGQKHNDSDVSIRIFPIVLMTEGFPINPLVLAELRARVAARALFEGINSAPVEVFDLVELEMLEAIAEVGGPSLPELLEEKSTSNYWSDSLRSYLISRPDLELIRARRLKDALNKSLLRIAMEIREP